MLMLVICSTFVGAVLGMRFGVLALLTSLLLGLFAGAVAGVAASEGFAATLLTMVSIATALQLGYLGGATTRCVVATTRMAAAKPTRAASRPAHQS
jgi:hypothetical protein